MAPSRAYVEIEGKTLKNLDNQDLLILAALVKNQHAKMAYSELSTTSQFLLRIANKSTFFQNLNYLQKLGLLALIKKKVGRYYTMESQILLSELLLYFDSIGKG